MDKMRQHKRRLHENHAPRRPTSIPSHKNVRRSTAVRRDDHQPVRIGVTANSWDTIYGKGSGLQGVRNTGVFLRSHENLSERHQNRRSIMWIIVLVGLFILIPTLLYFWMVNSNASVQGELSQSLQAPSALSSTASSATQTPSSHSETEK